MDSACRRLDDERKQAIEAENNLQKVSAFWINKVAEAKARREALRKAEGMDGEDSKGRTLLWHAAYYNDSTAAIIIINMLPHTKLILEPDHVYHKGPLELSKMHRNSDCFDVFKRYVNQKDLDEHWHHKKDRDTLLLSS